MIPKGCKCLAEVDFPIAEVSRHSVREKSIRHGHPNTLHLWWARRPLASSRAVLLALLWPDPCDSLCPSEFKEQARKLLRQVAGCNPGTTDEDLRKALLKFIADFANWDLASNRTYLDVSRALVKAAHGDEQPLVVDPFAGGGSIPLEALRVGCEAFASDLNPVACLILKVMLEDIPRHGPKLVDELRKVGTEIKRQGRNELADLYPNDADRATPIAYLWARTVRCESPNCGAEIPLVRSYWLCTKANRRRALRPRIERPNGGTPRVEFEIFEPRAEKDARGGTVTRAKATCACCGAVLPPERVCAQLFAQRGGADVLFDKQGHRIGGARMLAVVMLRPGETGRHYRIAIDRDYEAVRKAQTRVAEIVDEWERGGKQGHCPVPDEPLPPVGTLGFRVQRYGMLRWGDLFTARQKMAFVSLGDLVSSASTNEALNELLAMICTKLSDRCNSLVNWSVGVECPNQLFKGNAVPMAWDFAESNVLSDSSASIAQSLDNIARNAEVTHIQGVEPASCQLADACASPLADQASSVWFTDPPYYDAAGLCRAVVAVVRGRVPQTWRRAGRPRRCRAVDGRARRQRVRRRICATLRERGRVGGRVSLAHWSSDDRRARPRSWRLPVRERLRRRERLGSSARPAGSLGPTSGAAQVRGFGFRCQPAAVLARVESGCGRVC
jgi:putative DNA methylase